MYPPDQEASNNAQPAFSYTGPSFSTNQGSGENAHAMYNEAPVYGYETSTSGEAAMFQTAGAERQSLLAGLLAYPGRSIRSFCLPGMRTFARETLSARWDVVWISIFALPLLSSLIALALVRMDHYLTSSMLAGIFLGPLLGIPILFFIVQGMIWPLARHYQGGGSFLEQCYTTFLPLAPLFLFGSVAAILIATNTVSLIGSIVILLELLLFVYSSILLVIALKAVHGLTTWEAFTLAILPIFSILVVLIIVLIIAFVVAANSNGSSSDSSGSSGNNSNSSSNSGQGSNTTTRSYRNGSWWWWWWGPSYSTSSGTSQTPGSKIQWLCPACNYRRWLRIGPQEVTCDRCGALMQATEVTRK